MKYLFSSLFFFLFVCGYSQIVSLDRRGNIQYLNLSNTYFYKDALATPHKISHISASFDSITNEITLFNNLQMISFEYYHYSIDAFKNINFYKLKKLQALSFCGDMLKDSFPNYFSKCKEIEFLELINIKDPHFKLGENVTQFKSLKYLSIDCENIDIEKSFNDILALKELEYLSLSNCKQINQLAVLSKLKHIKYLNLRGGEIENINIWEKILPQFPNLITLDLSYSNINSIPSSIDQLTNLKCLILEGIDNVKGLKYLDNMHIYSLQMGDFVDCRVDFPTDLHLPKLRQIYCISCNLDEIPVFLENSPDIEEIDFRGSDIKEIVIDLKKLPNLKLLKL